jgi:hypothetical protein
MDRDIMEVLVPVTDINLHFTVLKDSLRGIGTPVIDIFVVDIDIPVVIDTSVVGTEGEDIEDMVVYTGVVVIDTSMADTGEEAIEVVIVDDVNDNKIRGGTLIGSSRNPSSDFLSPFAG